MKFKIDEEIQLNEWTPFASPFQMDYKNLLMNLETTLGGNKKTEIEILNSLESAKSLIERFISKYKK